ncbi:hypothetical protein BH11MYX3_BH11MYX3_39220 [soil metagenome]
MRGSLVLFTVGVGLLTTACGTDTMGGDDSDAPVPRATWYQDVAPILSKHCMSCHSAGGIAPFSLPDYDDAVEVSAMMVTKVDAGEMPPFDAREEADCTPRFGWQDDPRLSATEKATLHAWIEDGHALGTEAPIAAPPSTALEGISKTLTPTQGWTTTGTKDQFVCYVLDPGNTQLTWLTGLQVRPGNDLVVHHAVLTEVTKQPDIDAIVAQRGIGQPWDCSASATPGDFVVNVWTPGNQPMNTPTELAVPLVPNAKIVMQIHYHPANHTNDIDFTSVDLKFSTVWPRKMYFVAAIGNEFAAPNLEPSPDEAPGAMPAFMIPRNAANHPENMNRTLDSLGGLTGVKVFSVNPHMHLVGTHISGKIVRPTARGAEPKQECLANGAWNFDWQRTYIYDAPIDSLPSIEAGDRIEVSCRWNNTIENPFVQRMLADSNLPPQPIDISLGEQTTNEMCLEIFGLAVDAPPKPTAIDAPFALPDLATFGRNLRLPAM